MKKGISFIVIIVLAFIYLFNYNNKRVLADETLNLSDNGITYKFQNKNNKWYLVQELNSNDATILKYTFDNKKNCFQDEPTLDNLNEAKKSCQYLSSKQVYFDKQLKYIKSELKYNNKNIKLSYDLYFRKNLNITEHQSYTYFSNGKLNRFTKYFNAYSYLKDKVNYRDTYTTIYNAKGQLLEIKNYQNVILNNGNYATILYSHSLYTYHNNGKYKSKTYIKYSRTNGDRYDYFQTNYRTNGIQENHYNYDYHNGKIIKRTLHQYNSYGKLGKGAYRYISDYNGNQKIIKTYKKAYK
ncbi:MAG: hypothetical protein LBT75_05470 [Bacilli bacterium]|jgi:hypothetical protein|nr:hypothetical protein [Bacilli bacterium]